MILRVDRRPAVELQAPRRRAVAQERERQLAVLAGVLRPGDDHLRIAARHDLRLAVEVRRCRQQWPQRRAAERPGRLLTHLIVDEGQRLAVGDQQDVAARIFEPDPAGPLELQRAVIDMALGIGLREIRGHRLDRADVALEPGQIG